jgi:hypothetical protein
LGLGLGVGGLFCLTLSPTGLAGFSRSTTAMAAAGTVLAVVLIHLLVHLCSVCYCAATDRLDDYVQYVTLHTVLSGPRLCHVAHSAQWSTSVSRCTQCSVVHVYVTFHTVVHVYVTLHTVVHFG